MLFKSLWLLSLYLPFQIALSPAEGVDMASIRVLILILFFIWLAKGLKDKKLIIKNNIQTALVISFLSLSVLSLFFAANQGWSERKLLYLFSIFPIFFIFSSEINSGKKVEKIIKGLVLSGSVAAFIGIVQFSSQFLVGIQSVFLFWSEHAVIPFLGKSFGASVLENPSWLVNISGNTYLRATSIFPDPHMFSFFLGLLLPLSLALAFISRKTPWIISSALILMADTLTFSRGGYLALAASALISLFIFWNRIGKRYKLAVISGSLLLLLFLAIPGPISFRFFSSFDLKEGSNRGRLEMWKKAGETVMRYPFFGVGLGNFPLVIDPKADYRNSIYAHNTYLDISSETGIAAGLVWIGLLFFSALAFLKKSRFDPLYLGGAISIIIFSTHSFFETGLYSPVVLTLFLIVISFSGMNLNAAHEKNN